MLAFSTEAAPEVEVICVLCSCVSQKIWVDTFVCLRYIDIVQFHECYLLLSVLCGTLDFYGLHLFPSWNWRGAACICNAISKLVWSHVCYCPRSSRASVFMLLLVQMLDLQYKNAIVLRITVWCNTFWTTWSFALIRVRVGAQLVSQRIHEIGQIFCKSHRLCTRTYRMYHSRT